MWFELDRGDTGGTFKRFCLFLLLAAILTLLFPPATSSLGDKAILIYQSRADNAHVVLPLTAPLVTLRWLEGPKIFSKGEVLRCNFQKGVIDVIGLDKVQTQLNADILVCGESRFVIIGISLNR